MTVAICTLFEGHYHYGVAVLANSLYRNGFSGKIFAGYRGALPDWAAAAQPASSPGWHGARVLALGSDRELHFLPLETTAHITNYKSEFMLRLVADSPDDALLYLDPDICLDVSFQFIRDWMSCGVALCEDQSSPLYENHPRRVGWRRHFAEFGCRLGFKTAAYVNAGCVGVSPAQFQLLENWHRLIACMGTVIGGLGGAKVVGGTALFEKGFASCFDNTDQDALNSAIEMTEGIELSILPKTAMAFEPGAWVIPHSIGIPKPWGRHYLADAIVGRTPTTADKVFWKYADGPIQTIADGHRRRQQVALRAGSAVGRMYRRR
jgi:hypothetical protein